MNDKKEKQPGILEKLTEYAGSDAYPFHMPGHKRREIPDSLKTGFPDPYSIDITEIDGFDNLHHAEGILKDAMDQAAKIYGADRSWYLVNGSTCGILSAVCGLTKNGGKILAARNCHKAVYHAIYFNRLEAEYLYPEEITEFGINGGIRAEDVREALKRDAMKYAECREGMEAEQDSGSRRERKDSIERAENYGSGENAGNLREKKTRIQAVLVTSPTYEGVVSDIRAIADAAHEYGIPLFVDEAHGAHLPFADGCKSFPKSALEYGADVVIQSLHKTLPSFTQTAILHVKGHLADQEKIARYLSMFQTSSPSYLFMAGMQRCIRYMDQDGRKAMALYEKRLEHFMEQMKGLRVLKIFTKEICRPYQAAAGWDPSKLVISTKDAKEFHGEDLAELLRRKYHLEMEMTAPEYVIAMTSLMDTEEGFERFGKALLEIDKTLSRRGESVKKAMNENQAEREATGNQSTETWMKPSDVSKKFGKYETPEAAEFRNLRPVKEMLICDAMDGKTERTELENTAGKVSAEFVYLYPPGIPIIAPGERFTETIVEKIMKYQAAGLLVQGPSDPAVETILTVAENV